MAEFDPIEGEELDGNVMDKRYDVVVIGGGQAGLAMGYHLARQRLDFLVLDAAPRVGDAWRNRWDSLTLFTPARFSTLPGLPFPGDPDGLPGKDEVADYLELYAQTFALPIRTGEAVRALRPLHGASGYEIETANSRYEARQVVVAIGPFQRPFVPPFAASLVPEVVQVHSSAYLNPAQLPDGGTTLVVGGGNSGVQIAAELAASRPTALSLGEPLRRLPERVLGRSLFWWLERTGAMDASVDSWLGRRASSREMLIGQSPRMVARDFGVRLLGRAERAEARRVITQGGEAVEITAVVWATGFRPDYSFVEVSVFDAHGRPVHRRGVTDAPGLYFLGLSWQHTRGSALLGWVGRDAAYLAERLGESEMRSR